MSCFAAVFAQFGVGLDGGSGGYFFSEPVGEGGLLGYFASGAETGNDGRGVVAFWIGEVAEVKGGFDGGIGGG